MRLWQFVLSLGLILSPVAEGQSLKSIDDVEALLKRPDAPRSVESFLESAAAINPELFSHFSLMRESQSLQSASPAAPRAIVFGKDARFVLTFNGAPDQGQFHHIEMMQFVTTGDGTGRFELREIEFDPSGKNAPALSTVNPAKCARCHGTDPKPLWEEYDKWPGAYGEDDDALIDFDEPGRYSTTLDRDNKIVAKHRLHLKEFRDFLAIKDSHPRYQWLRIPTDTGSPVAPFIPKGRTGQFPLRPNLNLTKHFSELNAMRVARKFSDSGQSCFETGAPVVASLILDCDGVESERDAMNAVTQQLLQDKQRHVSNRPAALSDVIWSARNPSFYKDGRVWLLEMMGFSDFDWTPSRLKRQWQYFQGFKDTSDDILAAMWPGLQAIRGMKLPPYRQIRTELNPQYYSDDGSYRDFDGSGRNQACSSLGDAVRRFDIESLRAACRPADLAPGVVPPVVEMCMSCHDGMGQAPALPLEDAAAVRADPILRQWIFDRINAVDDALRMPPTRPLTVREYQDLQDFYQAVEIK